MELIIVHLEIFKGHNYVANVADFMITVTLLSV